MHQVLLSSLFRAVRVSGFGGLGVSRLEGVGDFGFSVRETGGRGGGGVVRVEAFEVERVCFGPGLIGTPQHLNMQAANQHPKFVHAFKAFPMHIPNRHRRHTFKP